DDFFELGSDSILCIQISAKAAQKGLAFTLQEFYQNSTIAALDKAARRKPITAEQTLIVGDVPLTPIQVWFFERNFSDPYHFNQAFLLETRTVLDAAVMRAVLARLVEHHDSLRLRFRQVGHQWEQFIAPAEPAELFTRVDLTMVPPS